MSEVTIGIVDGLEEAPADGVTYGRRDAQWVDMTSPANLQVRQGIETERLAVIPLSGEPVWATDSKRLYVGDGATQGGVLVGPRSFAVKSSSSTELVRGGAVTSRTPDPNATLTLGGAGTYAVWMYLFFQAENEPEEGDPGLTLKISLPSSGFSYLDGTSSAEETETGILDTPGYAYEKKFVCVTSSANAVLVPSWYRSAGSDGLVRGNFYIIAWQVL
jgi:hypothetical protein